MRGLVRGAAAILFSAAVFFLDMAETSADDSFEIYEAKALFFLRRMRRVGIFQHVSVSCSETVFRVSFLMVSLMAWRPRIEVIQ